MPPFTHNDFVIGRPDGWKDLSTVILSGPPEGDFSPNITITREPLDKPVKPAEYAAQQLPALEEELGELGFLAGEEGPAKIGEIQAYQRMHTLTMPDTNVELQQWQVYVVNGQEGITITATDKAATFDKNYPIFKAAIGELKLLKK